LGDTWVENQLKSKAYNVGGQSYVDQDILGWAQDPFKDLTFIDPNNPETYSSLGYSLDPNYDFWARKQLIDTQGNAIQPFSWNAANAGDYYNQRAPWDANATAPLFAYLDVGYKKDPTTGALQESSYFLPTGLFNTVGDFSGSKQHAYSLRLPENFNAAGWTQYGAPTKINGQEGVGFSSWDNYLKGMEAAGLDPYGSLQADYQWAKSGGGGFLGSLGKVMNIVAPILAFTPLAPIAAGWSLGSGLATGNIGQIIGGGLGVAGGLGYNVPGAVGSSISGGLGLNLSQNAMNAIGSAAISGGTGLLTGQKLSDVLKSAALSGGGSYLNSTLFDKNSGVLKDATPLQKVFANAALRGGMTGLAGGNPLQSALGSLISSGAGALGGAVQQNTGSKFAGGLTSGATSALLRAMLLQNLSRR